MLRRYLAILRHSPTPSVGLPLSPRDEFFMKLCLEEARTALAKEEVPVGCVIVKDDVVISVAHNVRETTHQALAHAETLAIQKACEKLQSWRLVNCTLYVTLEPCLMCAGAIVQARLPRVVFGAFDPKAGACGSLYEVHLDSRLNHNFMVEGGVLQGECAQLLKDFFKKKRQ